MLLLYLATPPPGSIWIPALCLSVWLSTPIVLASVTKCCLCAPVCVRAAGWVCFSVLTSAHNSTRLLATSRADLTDVAYCFILLPRWLMTETAYKSNLSSPNCVCVCRGVLVIGVSGELSFSWMYFQVVGSPFFLLHFESYLLAADN